MTNLAYLKSGSKRYAKQRLAEKVPGSILRDFDELLNFIEETQPQVTARQQLFSMRSLEPLNARLSHPVELSLARPQQKTFPPINGLFLLARASGLTFIDPAGKRLVLQVDQDARQLWERLNPTEQYFNLLEVWLIYAGEEIIGERPVRGILNQTFTRWLWFFHTIPDAGFGVTGAEADRLRYTPGLHNLALLELFGFVTLDHSSPKPGQSWPVERVQRTSLGEAMLAVCAKWFADFDNVLNFDELESMEPGQFQPFFRSYFPEWRNNLILPQQPFREGVFVFKVMLDKNCWRRIAIPADATLEDLSDAIMDGMRMRTNILTRTWT